MDRLIMMGYVYCYTNQRDKAYEVLSKAHKLNRREDKLITSLMENAQPPDVILDEIKAEANQ